MQESNDVKVAGSRGVGIVGWIFTVLGGVSLASAFLLPMSGFAWLKTLVVPLAVNSIAAGLMMVGNGLWPRGSHTQSESHAGYHNGWRVTFLTSLVLALAAWALEWLPTFTWPPVFAVMVAATFLVWARMDWVSPQSHSAFRACRIVLNSFFTLSAVALLAQVVAMTLIGFWAGAPLWLGAIQYYATRFKVFFYVTSALNLFISWPFEHRYVKNHPDSGHLVVPADSVKGKQGGAHAAVTGAGSAESDKITKGEGNDSGGGPDRPVATTIAFE